MLNSKGERELAYVVKIDNIFPIPNYDRVEQAVVGGWRIIVRKNQFNIGDYAIYFEIDSKVPECEPFLFLASKHFKVKTIKMCKTISQGLLMSFDDFIIDNKQPNWLINLNNKIAKGEDITHYALTKDLGVIYSVAEDNQRKASKTSKVNINSKYKFIMQYFWVKQLMKYKYSRNCILFFFGQHKKQNDWPKWVSKTDEERVQNMLWILSDKEPWIATEKIDGTSTTATYKKHKFFGHDFYICSRNVVFDKPTKKCFYDTNVYQEMAQKYNFENILADIVKKYHLEWATLQGETYGQGIQKRDYHLKGHDFMGFNLIFSDRGRLNSIEAANIMAEYNIPWVPIIDTNYILPDTVDELLDYATGMSVLDYDLREGIVFRSLDGTKSFKAVSNQFLLKYHS